MIEECDDISFVLIEQSWVRFWNHQREEKEKEKKPKNEDSNCVLILLRKKML